MTWLAIILPVLISLTTLCGQSTPFVARIEKRSRPASDTSSPSIFPVTYARRQDGSFVWKSGQATEIFDARTSRCLLIEPSTRSVQTLEYSPLEYHQMIAALESENCGALPATAPKRQRLGHVVRRDYREYPGMTSERWIAPQLRCFSLLTIDRRSDGATVEEEVIASEEREPDPRLFAIPSGFTERSPEELNREYFRVHGKAYWDDAAVGTLERRYRRLRANRTP